jgi:hypothetical protein
LLSKGGGGVKGGGGGDEVQGVWDPSMRFGLVMRDVQAAGKPKRLTFEERGLTNNTVLRLDGGEWIFGERPFRTLDGKKEGGRWPGRWLEMEANLGKNDDGSPRYGKRSVWFYDDQKVQVTQTAELVAGEQSGRLDTCLVKYRIENQDAKPHRVGLRFLLDTYIGDNDGVPFLIPGKTQLIDTTYDERNPDNVPTYIQACESEDLAHPGTVARLQFRLSGLEAPARVTLGAWPDVRLGGGCRQEKTLWEVPVFSIKKETTPDNPNGDSCVVMYWPEKALNPKETREVGFAYGLGDVTSSGGRLGLTAAGSFTPGGEVTVTAYVSDPRPGETAKLTLPDGWRLADGQAEQPVPPLPPGAASRNSPVTWKVRCGPVGDATLQVETSGGASQTKKVTVKTSTIY